MIAQVHLSQTIIRLVLRWKLKESTTSNDLPYIHVAYHINKLGSGCTFPKSYNIPPAFYSCEERKNNAFIRGFPSQPLNPPRPSHKSIQDAQARGYFLLMKHKGKNDFKLDSMSNILGAYPPKRDFLHKRGMRSGWRVLQKQNAGQLYQSLVVMTTKTKFHLVGVVMVERIVQTKKREPNVERILLELSTLRKKNTNVQMSKIWYRRCQ